MIYVDKISLKFAPELFNFEYKITYAKPSKALLSNPSLLETFDHRMQRYWDQGRSHNLKEVPQNFTEVFNINGVTANDVIQRNQHRQEKKINLSSILITDVKLAL